MNLVEFLASLAKVDIRLWVDSGNLRFSAAEGAMTDEIKQKIIANKADIIAFLQQSAQNPQNTPIEPVDRNQLLPLSYAQERFWFLYQLEPDSSAYNMAGALRIKGQLRLDILNRALNEISRRHEILRTRFIDNQGQTEQHIDAPQNWGLVATPLSGSEHIAPSKSDQLDELISKAAQEETNRVFNLATEHPIRGQLYSLGHQDHLLLITLHHIACDGWSLGVLTSEIAAIYNAIAASLPIPLAPLPIQYADYAVWQREHLNGEELEKQQSYWQQQLAGLTPLNLPTDFARPPIAGHQGDSTIFTIDRQTTLAINQLAKQQGATLFMALMASFKVLLARYSRQDDICVGTPVANRNQSALEPLIGCFLNTLAIRTDLSGKPTFTELLAREQTNAQHAFEHQDLPFAKVVDALKLPKDMAFTPVYQTLFVLQNAPTDKSIQLPGLTIEPVELEKNNAQFDLKLSINEHEGQLVCEFEYRTDLFQKATILRMTQHFAQLLSSIAENPNQDITQLAMITEQEKSLLLSCEKGSWNDTAINYEEEYGKVNSLHQLFEQQVAKTPEAIAIQYQNTTLSYQALNHRANYLADVLINKHGVKPNTPVALCLQRSLDMSVALLAILKAGGCYLPCDPSLPKDRLSYMLEDTDSPVLLSQTHLQDNLPKANIPIIWINDWLEATDFSHSESQNNFKTQENPSVEVEPQHLFNIIYTSGSTGKPKGVMVPHQGIINRLIWMQETYPINTDDVVLQKTPYSFDVSVWELFWPLITGAKLVYAKPEGHKDPEYLRDLIISENVTTLHFVPSMLGVFLQTSEIEQCRSIQRVFCSGEALQVEHQRRFLQRLHGKELHNLYGPTEASIDVSYYACSVNSQYTSVPIGKPVANTQLHVLDEHLQPMPVGVPGELYIGGIQLAHGYLNRHELTQSTFIDNPYYQSQEHAHPSPKLYKTGDLARWLPDGNIEYIGRTDYQVKIRGLRIELGEIEAELSKQVEIKECVVVATELASGTQTLVAYLIAQNAVETVDSQVLNQALSQNLPDYMIPAVYMWLDEFPLSANGKLDRKALPKPDFNQREKEYIAPSNETEALIAHIWQSLLQVERVGVTDNFFELGGHSLLATQFVSRLREESGYNLALKTIFTHPTINQLSQVIQDTPQHSNQPKIIKVDRNLYPDGLPLSYAQQRLWLIDQLQPGSPMYNIPLAVKLYGELNIKALEQSFETIINRHESLRTRFIRTTHQTLQVIQPTNQWKLDQKTVNYDQSQLDEAVSQFMARGFDLANDSLIRIELWKVEGNIEQHSHGDKCYILLINLHHIISDGWSMDILIEELMRAYNAYSHNLEPQLTDLSIQYPDYALWQKDWLQGDVLNTQVNYWKAQLNNVPVLAIPNDNTRPAVMDPMGYSLPFELPDDTTQALRALSKQQGTTLFMTVLAAFKVLLSRYSGQDDICIGTPIANRTQASMEPLIGFFVNTLAIRSYPKAKQSFLSFLDEVKNTTLDAYAHQDVSFEHLVDELNVPRDMSHSPIFQAVFALQTLTSTSSETIKNSQLGDLSLEPYSFQNNTHNESDGLQEVPVKFDLHMGLQDHGDKISGELEFRHSVFDVELMLGFVQHFTQLLAHIVQAPESPIGKIALLNDAEQQSLVDDHNKTDAVIPAIEQNLSLHQIIEQQVDKTPNAIAIQFGELNLSYQALNEQANQLAWQLRDQGVTANKCVGVCLPTSPKAMISILAIIKAGGAYVPMDITYPAERLQHMASNANMDVLITNSDFSCQFPQLPQVIDIDQLDTQSYSTTNLPSVNTLDDLLYVVYTSGSTGLPKGAGIRHRNELNLLHWYTNEYQMTANDKSLIISALGFDLTQKNLFSLLCVGGTVVLPEHPIYDPGKISNVIQKYGITLINCAPSAFYALAEQYSHRLDNLRCVLFGGEPIQLDRLKGWLTQTDCQLINMYGPTECTDIAASYCLQQEDLSDGITSGLPIGKPNSNVKLYILDEHFQQIVPKGVAGELCIAGDGVGTGYINNSELTKTAFIETPFGLVYRTGDLVRYRNDGNLEFLARIDGQVKIRGFRIELGEIEATLKQESHIRDAVVTDKIGTNGQTILAAYLVMESEHTELSNTNIQDLKAHCKKVLPDYMVPAAYVTINHIPLTPNGKIDRKALPEPNNDAFAKQAYIAPETEVQIRLADMWGELLNIKQIGLADNFFELGGNSLIASQAIAQAQDHFGVEIDLRKLFENPTISETANLIEKALIEQNLLLADDDIDLADDDEEEFIL